MILLDTNMLTRLTKTHDPQSGVARTAIQTLLVRLKKKGVMQDSNSTS
jgi:hypothetical protein